MSESDTTDDDLGIDLEAWQPPPVPGGIADAVLARLGQEHTSITQITATPVGSPGRRWWIVGATAAALVASGIAAVALVGMTRPPKSGQGSVVAVEPRHLELGPTSAEIDRGTTVTWRRDEYRLTATQTGGAATWRVDEDDTVRIDAALASIEASNANLRVEVTMDDERARTRKTIGTSAVTAAAVALVTVIVYDGAVRVTHDGKTAEVAAGTTYRVGENVIEEGQLTVGGSPDVTALTAEIERLRAEQETRLLELEQLQQEVERERLRTAKRDPYATPRPTYRRDDLDVPMTSTPASCDADALAQEGKDSYSQGLYARAMLEFQTAYRCKPDPSTLKLLFAASCRAKDIGAARRSWKQLPQNTRGQVLPLCVGVGITIDQLDANDTGRLRVRGMPAARILVDGQPVGMTPLALDLPPGKHKVTYVVGNDKYTFSVQLKAGETVTLHKDLQ